MLSLGMTLRSGEEKLKCYINVPLLVVFLYVFWTFSDNIGSFVEVTVIVWILLRNNLYIWLLKHTTVIHLLRMWTASKKKKKYKKPRNDWSEWCVEAGVEDLSATKWLAMPSLCVLRPECILYESPDMRKPHSWVMYQTGQITPLSSCSPPSRGGTPWSYRFSHFLCCHVCWGRSH